MAIVRSLSFLFLDDFEFFTCECVGTLNELEKPCVAFIRLSRGEMLGHMAEVPLPVRFLFICVGPESSGTDYIEIGRSFSTLLSNEVSPPRPSPSSLWSVLSLDLKFPL